MQWKRRDSNAHLQNPRISLKFDPSKGRSKSPRRRGVVGWLLSLRVVQLFALFVLAVCWNWTNGDPLLSFPSWSGGGGKTCVRGLVPPQVPTDSDDTPLYTFPDSAKPFEGTYLPIRRSKSGDLDELRLENVVRGSEEVHPVPDCLDDHLSVGAPCPELDDWSTGSGARNDGKVDVVWVYANTSDHLHRFHHHLSSPPPKAQTTATTTTQRHPDLTPREFDELRYSLRSVLTHFRGSAGQLTIVVPDYPFPGCGSKAARRKWKLGQLPRWLKLPSRVPYGRELEWWDGAVSLRVVHHSTLVGEKSWPAGGVSFNSLGVEARLPYIEGVSDVFVYMNDDVFFASHLTTEDFYSPHLGPIFRLQPDLLVHPNKPKTGEWGALIRTNELLDQRFGHRPRPYVAHTSKTLSLPHLREVASTWSSALHRTSTHAHRTPQEDVSITFLQTHYTIERWREALLWSFVVATVGGDDDQWTEEQMRAAWMRLGGDPMRREVSVKRGRRRTTEEEGRGGRKTRIAFASYDGYPHTGLGRSGFKEYPDLTSSSDRERGTHQANRCTLRLAECFTVAEGKVKTASEVFKNVAFRNPQCGDCIISALVTQSGETGLSAFLPDPSRRFPTRRGSGRRTTTTAAEPGSGGGDNVKQSRLGGYFYNNNNNKVDDGNNNLVVVPRLPVAKSWETADFTLRGVAPPPRPGVQVLGRRA
ncbi:hypothetical protein FRB90_006471 [Tulasnella sp. 427]|nr:hypothetical protein FRB90_006471 [Tulasnella sp. 427]